MSTMKATTLNQKHQQQQHKLKEQQPQPRHIDQQVSHQPAEAADKKDEPTKDRHGLETKKDETQKQPGIEAEMEVKPKFMGEWYHGSDKLKDKIALITGGDSGIGRSVAIFYAREGADIAINYLDKEETDAREVKKLIENEGRRCLLLPGDLTNSEVCTSIVTKTVEHFGKLDILVNNAAQQHMLEKFEDITEEQINTTFRTNIVAMMLTTKEALKHLPAGGSIINSSSVTAFRGSAGLVDYASTKGAIVAFTRSLALQLAERDIRVNSVAPGPIWTPLIVATFDKEKRKEFGQHTAMKRAGHPEDCAPSYVFLASRDSNYFTGQTLHPNGGSVVNA